MDILKRITIEPTNNCNLYCLPCPRYFIDMPPGFMDWPLFASICDQIPKSVTDIILSWRGEPTLHSDLHGMCHRTPIKPVIATNGCFLDRIPIKSIKAINLSIHNKLSYGHLLYLLDIKGDAQVKITASRVQGEIPNELWLQVKATPGVDEFRTYQRHSEDGVWGSIRSDGQCFTLQGQRECLCPRLKTDLVIGWDGSVSRCCYVWETIKGLDANTMTLQEIWQSEQLQAIRDRYPDHICARCDQWRTDRTL